MLSATISVAVLALLAGVHALQPVSHLNITAYIGRWYQVRVRAIFIVFNFMH